MGWNPNTAPNASDAIIEQWVTPIFGEPRAFTVRHRITHTDLDDHLGALQWLPTVNAAPQLNQLVRYGGGAPWTRGGLTTSTLALNAATTTLAATEQWAAWIGPDNRGIALYSPASYQF